MRRISLALFIALFLPGLAAGASKDTKLTLVAYSTPKDAYGQLITAFQKTKAGNGVSFSQSYAASGEQSRAVAAGPHAGVLPLSPIPDPPSPVPKKRAPPRWYNDNRKGIASRAGARC